MNMIGLGKTTAEVVNTDVAINITTSPDGNDPNPGHGDKGSKGNEGVVASAAYGNTEDGVDVPEVSKALHVNKDSKHHAYCLLNEVGIGVNRGKVPGTKGPDVWIRYGVTDLTEDVKRSKASFQAVAEQPESIMASTFTSADPLAEMECISSTTFTSSIAAATEMEQNYALVILAKESEDVPNFLDASAHKKIGGPGLNPVQHGRGLVTTTHTSFMGGRNKDTGTTPIIAPLSVPRNPSLTSGTTTRPPTVTPLKKRMLFDKFSHRKVQKTGHDDGEDYSDDIGDIPHNHIIKVGVAAKRDGNSTCSSEADSDDDSDYEYHDSDNNDDDNWKNRKPPARQTQATLYEESNQEQPVCRYSGSLRSRAGPNSSPYWMGTDGIVHFQTDYIDDNQGDIAESDSESSYSGAKTYKTSDELLYVPNGDTDETMVHEIRHPLLDDYIKSTDDYRQMKDIFKLVYMRQYVEGRQGFGFVWEEMNSSYEGAAKRERLLEAGPFGQRRMTYVHTLHFVFTSWCQCYVARTARHPHYQAMFSQLLTALPLLEMNAVRLRIYMPYQDHSTDLLVIRNGESAWSICHGLPFEGIPDMLQKYTSPTQTTGGMQRQSPRKGQSFGYTGSMCTSRVHSNSGHAIPVTKAGTSETVSVQFFLAATRMARSIRTPWCPDGDYFANEDDSVKTAANKIHPRNRFTSCHLAESGPKYPCQPHTDPNNSEIVTEVFGMAIDDLSSMNGVRHSANVQQRKSVDDSCMRPRDQGGIGNELEKLIEEAPEHRRSITSHHFDGNRAEYLPGILCIRNECNFDPVSFVMSISLAITRLTLHFHLTYLEVIGLWMAYHVRPNQSYFFMAASYILLSADPRSIDREYRGPSFGRMFAQLIVSEERQVRGKQTWRRFNCYRPPEISSAKVWDRTCIVLTRYMLYFNAAFGETPRAPSKKEMQQAYKLLVAFVIKSIDNTGLLVANHSLLALSLVGAVPWWVRTCCVVDPGAGYIKTINERFQLQQPLTNKNNELMRFIDSMVSRLSTSFGDDIFFTYRYVENLLCKFKIITGNRKSSWCDTMGLTDPLIVLKGNNMFIVHSDGSSDMVPGPLMSMFGCGNSVLSITELIDELRIPTNVPTEREYNRVAMCSNWRKVFYSGSPTSFELEFTLGDPPELGIRAQQRIDEVLRMVRLYRTRRLQLRNSSTDSPEEELW